MKPCLIISQTQEDLTKQFPVVPVLQLPWCFGHRQIVMEDDQFACATSSLRKEKDLDDISYLIYKINGNYCITIKLNEKF